MEALMKNRKKNERRTKDLVVRYLDSEIWIQARAKALQSQLNIGEVINRLLQAWIEDRISIEKRGE
jgi:hypothetical protein